MFRIEKENTIVILLLVFCLFAYTRGLLIHGVEYRDDEIFYYQSTQEMIRTGDIWSPTYFGEDRFQKPILFYWFILLSYKIFGLNWFGARFIAALFGSLTVCVTYKMAREYFDRRTALLSSVVLMSLPLFLRHAKNAVPDMPLTFFIVAACYCAIKFMKNPSLKKYNLLFFIACALGFMVKGFAALIIPFLTVIIYSLMIRQPRLLSKMKFGRGIILFLLIVLPWFIFMIKTHGTSYLEYMVVEETKNRIVGEDNSNIVFKQVKRFGNHSLFYLRNMMSYFLPWSLFGIFAIPALLFKRFESQEHRQAIQFFLIWFFVVFIIFANMYFMISHYLMSLAAPFSILVAYFILHGFKENSTAEKIQQFMQRYFILIILAVGFFAFAFLAVFLASNHKLWLGVSLLTYLVIIFIVCRKKDPMIAPVILGLFILFVFSQSSLMAKAGVTAHGTLQNFAKTIHAQDNQEYVLGVGSHDIHEKEFQVYFDRKIYKAGHSHEGRTKMQLGKLFNTKETVYCLLTEKDYNRYRDVINRKRHYTVQEEYMIRKRMNLDQGFFVALLKLDQEVARQYLMEKILLIRKDSNV